MAGKRIRPSQLASELKKIGSLATKKEMGIILQKLTVDGFRELVMRSARDTGFLRSNWDVWKENAPNSVLKNPGGTRRDATVSGVAVKAGDVIILGNNTEYAMFLERGTPRMRAQPMVEPTYHMLLRDARSLTRALSRKRAE